MFCNMCGQKLPDDSKFCVNCGAKVIAPSPKATQAHPNSSYSYVPPKGTAREVIYEPGKRPEILNARKPINHESRAFCNNCGAVLTPDMRFCTQCGKSGEVSSKSTMNYDFDESKGNVRRNTDNSSSEKNDPTKTAKHSKSKNTSSGKGWGGKLLILAVIIAVLVFFGKSGTDKNLEKGIIETLPYDLKAYILIQNNVETEYELEVTSVTINKHVTEGKTDTVDCTIELEDKNIKKTIFVELYCTKYNTGWQVNDWNELQEAKVIPKIKPDSQMLDQLAAECGYQNIAQFYDDLDMEMGVQIRTYTVDDAYEYLTISGEIETIAEFTKSTLNYSRDIDHYYWSYSVNNFTTPSWNVVGQWYLEGKLTETAVPYKAVINLWEFDSSGMAQGNSVYYYPRVDGNDWLGDYGTEDGGVSCNAFGSTPQDMCMTLGGRDCFIKITCNSCTGYIIIGGYEIECYTTLRS